VAAEVHEYTFAPHAMAERVLQLDQRLRTKLGIAASAVSPVECDELLRAELRGWRRDIAVPDEPAIAAVCASTRGALAILRIDGTARMLGAMDCQQLSDSPALLLEIVRMCHGRAGAVDRASREWLDGVVAQWRRTHSASEILAAHELPFGETRLKALHRVSQLLRDAPPHRRPVLESLAIAARRSLLAPAGVGVEQDIERLTDSNLDPEPLFRAIAAVGARVSCARKRESAVELVAAIILRDC
jgi:hypothetical protein